MHAQWRVPGTDFNNLNLKKLKLAKQVWKDKLHLYDVAI